ncbi:MAG: Rrf2 family transcriptional regulator [Proteobacteria bacterium]|nr:Rrf2 family transcriptional regulator [Pseudomonadota bacterium]
MRLTTKSRYGAKMFLDIALNSGDGPVRIRDISQRQGISIKYLEKLIYKLKEASYIKSKRGPKGGHIITRPLEDISVGDIVRVLEGDSPLTDFANSQPDCNEDLCLTQRVWVEASKAMFAKLDSISFSDLVTEALNCTKANCCLDQPCKVQDNEQDSN